MGVIRPNKPLSGNAPYLKRTGAPAKSKSPVVKKLEPTTKKESSDLVSLSDEGALKTVRDRSTPVSESRGEKSVPVAHSETAPKTINQEAQPAPEAEVDEETTNWVLESVATTPYANDPSMEIVKRRFGTLNKAVRSVFTDPLLDAITSSDPKIGSGKLKDLASAANWAQKFKKDAAKLAQKNDFASMVARAKELESGDKTEKTLLDGVLDAKSLRFSSELPSNRAKEANQLLQQYENGNDNPGIGSKALGKGISYLRGRKGTRIFYKQQGDQTHWLAVCDKSTEPKAIKILQKEFQLS